MGTVLFWGRARSSDNGQHNLTQMVVNDVKEQIGRKFGGIGIKVDSKDGLIGPKDNLRQIETITYHMNKGPVIFKLEYQITSFITLSADDSSGEYRLLAQSLYAILNDRYPMHNGAGARR